MNTQRIDAKTKTTPKQKQHCFNAMTETLYLTVMAVYILRQSFGSTLFNIPWSQGFNMLLHVIVLGAATLRLEYAWTYARKGLLACTLTCALSCFSWLFTRYAFLLDTALLVMGAIGIPYRKILKTGFWIELYVLFLALLGSLTGSIPDLIYPGGQFRHSFGIVYPTDFAARVVFLSLVGWVLYGGVRLVFPLTCAAGLAASTYHYCGAKCSTIVLILLALAILYFSLTEKHRGKLRTVSRLGKPADSALAYVLPFCAALMIGLTYFFDTEGAGWSLLDKLLTNRLVLGHAALDKYGIKLFGTVFDQIGYGGGVAWSSAVEYNFVDSSYVLVLVRYGIATLLAVCIQYVWLEKNAIRNGHRKLALAAALVAIHSMVEHHLPEVSYNLFLLLPFADFTPGGQEAARGYGNAARPSRRVYAICAIFFLGGAAAAMVFPRTISYAKTVVDVLQLSRPERHLWFISLTTVCLLVVGMLLWLLSKLATAYIRETSPPKNACISLGILFLAASGLFIGGNFLIRQGQAECQTMIEADRSVTEALMEAEDSAGKLYIDHIPEIYQREFGNIAGLILSAECLAPYRNTTLITEDSGELLYLMEAGYAYGRLASGHAVYTNSKPAKKILEDAGVVLTDYYSKQQTVDLREASLQNNLGLTESGTLLLDGRDASLQHGPGVTVYHGVLRVEYKLRLVSFGSSEGTAATAKISSDRGVKVWDQADILLEDFDENGECTYAMDIYLTSNCPGMEFLLILSDGVQLEVLEIKYGKVGVLGIRRQEASPL